MATTSEHQESIAKEGTAAEADHGVHTSAVTMQATIAPMEPNHSESVWISCTVLMLTCCPSAFLHSELLRQVK